MSQSPATDTLISHYRIVSKLGAGGMGEVWLAEDTRLDRKVALKLLPAEFTQDSERLRRFIQEAKAASALSHPNIISVYDIGECETGRFIVMELVSGRTLRSVIASDNSLETFFALGHQMARALSAAHAAGITHRDIKPDNIMVRDDGYVKVLDFGLARLLPTTSSDPEAMTLAQQTTPGTVMGTLAYMSPEQASGKTVGSASDVFALGIVLYELATGRHPFKSETMIGYLHAITSQVPPSMTSSKSHLPAALDELILRMLEKNAVSRPTATEVAQALQEIEKYGTNNTIPIRTVADKPKATLEDEGFWIAVLPFKYRGTNPDIEALAEGLSEDILTGLSRFSYLRVIARSSTLRFTSESADVRNVGKQLGARYVLEASLRQAGSLLRVSVQLVDANSGAHVWAETYDRPFRPEEIFALQDELVPKIVSSVADMHGALPRSMSEIVRLKSSDQLSAYEALLRSFGYNERFTPEELGEVRTCLERAVKEAPANGDCWAMLSVIYADEYGHWHIHQPDSLDKALRAARTAVQAAPLHSLPYYALAQALFFRKEIHSFRVAAERAVSLNPMDGATAAFMGLLIAYSGDWERGCALADKGLQLNPNHPGWYHYTAWHDAYRKQDYKAALDIALKLNAPDNFYTHAVLAMCYAQLGQMDAARKSLGDMLALKPDYASVARELHGKWIEPDLVEQLMDGLRKAGLEIADEAQPSAFRATPYVSSEARSDEGFWVAVLPFKFNDSNTEVATLAEGLSEEIVTGLSRFSYLRVIARSSTLRYASETGDVRTVGRELGARYVMEGSLRLAGSLLRVSVQMVDASTGAHLWAQTYDRPFGSEEIFALQDDLVPRIVSTVADAYGVLPHSMSQAVRSKDPNELTPYEALLRSFSYVERVSVEEHAQAKAALERAVEQAPGDANCWAMLSILLTDEYIHGFNPQPDSLERAQQAARRAVDADPSNHRAHQALAWALYYRKDLQASRNAAERAIALNPMDASTTVYMGQTIAYGGEWERGCTLIAGAIQLNPNHPGWYWYATFLDAYRKEDYRGALVIALKINMPGLSLGFVALAAAYGQLGESVSGSAAVRELLALRPDYAVHARSDLRKIWDAELVENLIDGLRKSGLDIPNQERVSALSFVRSVSSETRADEGFWIAVLPFKFTGTTELGALAEGLSEEIVTGLSRFSYLRVIARSSTLRYASETSDVRTVGEELRARYVMEGSLRHAASMLRVSVQLIDASTGAHLWAETYDRQFRAEDIFALQDDLVPRIVSTVADINGVLPRSMCEVVCNRSPDQLSPYEAVLRSFRYFDRVTPDELVSARSCLELAVEKAPTYADAWAMLAVLCVQDYAQEFNSQPDSLKRGATAAQRAVEAAPSNHLAHFSLAQAHFFQKEFQSFRNAADRAVALNPMDGNSLAYMGELLTYAGSGERGLALATRAKQINPNHPGWFWYADYFHAYGQGDYRGALSLIRKANLPGHWGMHAGIAAAAGQLGEREAATKAIGDLLRLRPDCSITIRNTFEKWFDPELREHLIDGLRKAGLEIADEISEPPDNTHLAASTAFPRFERRPAIAVLPFVNISNERENEYFCDGLAEELLNALSKIDSLQVAARTSAFYFKGKPANISEIGARLNVSTVLEGSVRKSGDRVRISVQLVNVTDGYHLWSEKYDREMKDIFDIQDEISLAIVEALKLKLLGTEQSVVKRYTDNTEAYQLYLKGRFFVNQRTSASLLKAIDYFNQAITLDSNYPLGYAGLADAYMVLGVPDAVTEALSPRDSLSKARAAAEKALQIDPSVAEIYTTLAHIKWKERDWVGAENDYRRSIELNPNNPIAHFYHAVCLAGLGRCDEAVKEITRAQELDPLSLPVNASVVYVLYLCRRYDEAIEAGKKTLDLDAAFPLTHQRLGMPYTQKKMYREAIAEFEQAVNNSNRAPQPLMLLGHAYAVSGNKVEALKVLAELKDLSQGRYVSPYGVAAIYVGLGEKEQAFEWLEKAFDEDNTELTFLKVDPRLDPLRDEPRFQELLERAGFPP